MECGVTYNKAKRLFDGLASFCLWLEVLPFGVAWDFA